MARPSVVNVDAMSTPRKALADQLRIRFALPPERPTDSELDAVLRGVDGFRAHNGRLPSADEWRTITLENVRFDGSYFYKGLNFQDLNALLATIRAQAQSAQSPVARK